jgi:hypothetical protein
MYEKIKIHALFIVLYGGIGYRICSHAGDGRPDARSNTDSERIKENRGWGY